MTHLVSRHQFHLPRRQIGFGTSRESGRQAQPLDIDPDLLSLSDPLDLRPPQASLLQDLPPLDADVRCFSLVAGTDRKRERMSMPGPNSSDRSPLEFLSSLGGGELRFGDQDTNQFGGFRPAKDLKESVFFHFCTEVSDICAFLFCREHKVFRPWIGGGSARGQKSLALAWREPVALGGEYGIYPL